MKHSFESLAPGPYLPSPLPPFLSKLLHWQRWHATTPVARSFFRAPLLLSLPQRAVLLCSASLSRTHRPSLPTPLACERSPRPPWPWPPLHAEPPLEPAPTPTNPQIRLLSSQRSSQARPSPPRLAGTPPQRHSTAAARRPLWNRLHGPPLRALRPPRGSSRVPLAFPQLSPCRR